MSAYQVSSSNADAVKIVETFHTLEAATKEVLARKALMHTGAKYIEVTVEPLAPSAMTRKAHRPAKLQAVTP